MPLIAWILLIVGVVLIIAELMVPGFGLIGALGLGSVIVSIVWLSKTLTQAVVLTLLAVVIVAVLFIISTIVFGKHSKFILKEEEKPEDGYVAPRISKNLVSKKGIALTDLHPSGAADIDGDRISVQTTGEYIDKNEKIIIVGVEAGIVKVKREV